MTLIFAPIATRKSMSAVRVGLRPTARITSREPGTMHPATRKNADDEMSPGTSSSLPVSVGLPCTLMAPRARGDLGAEFPQCEFCVVARYDALVHRGGTRREEPGQQHAAFYLRTRYRQRVLDGFGGPP